MKLSIVIPIYKAESWIGRCLDSVFTQGVSDSEFEVVCVVDGSPDKSAEVVRSYSDLHKNILLIDQVNNGVSSARNNGIKHAKGRYITFMDADDVMIEGSLSLLLPFLEFCEEELTVHRAFINNSEWCPWEKNFKDNELVKVIDAVARGFLHGSVWGCCYYRDFIQTNKIEFPEGVSNGEDNFFILSCLYFAKAVRFKNIKMYRVIEEEESLSRTFTKQKVDGMIRSDEIFTKYICCYPVIENKRFILQYIRYTRLSGLIARTIKTKGIGYFYLTKSGVSKQSHFNIDENVIYMRRNMKIMNMSFSLFYFMSWFKHVVFRK